MADDKKGLPPDLMGLSTGPTMQSISEDQRAKDLGEKLVNWLHIVRSGREDENPEAFAAVGQVHEAMQQGMTFADMFGPAWQGLRDALGAFRPSRPLPEYSIGELIRELMEPLTPDGKVNAEYVLRWLRSKATRPMQCPIDGENQWVVGEQLVQPMGWPSVFDTMTDTTYPQVVITCYVCGYTFYVNATLAGVLLHRDANQRGYRG